MKMIMPLKAADANVSRRWQRKCDGRDLLEVSSSTTARLGR